MKVKMLNYFITMIIGMLTPDMMKKFADSMLDFLEDAVSKSDSKMDDKLVLPLCGMIRTVFDIED